MAKILEYKISALDSFLFGFHFLIVAVYRHAHLQQLMPNLSMFHDLRNLYKDRLGNVTTLFVWYT